MAFAAKYTERNILFSGAVGSDSKIIYNRDPRDRVGQVAPWLTTDGDAYPAAVDGKIVWIVDAYTTLENYPYAQRSSLDGLVADSVDATTGRLLPKKEVSYIRNSVKATVDAYDGTVTLYQVDDNDPVLNAWKGVFPDTVKPQSDISDDLRATLPLSRRPVQGSAGNVGEVPRRQSDRVLHQQRFLVGAQRADGGEFEGK